MTVAVALDVAPPDLSVEHSVILPSYASSAGRAVDRCSVDWGVTYCPLSVLIPLAVINETDSILINGL